ncbi:helix-turn-helix transcriptional regulator [Methylobacterium amylolyticum]|uniref:helix-turn-helix transcriptional regulator n=1 Tax=Methylobacterium sp. NEAU 140 TaxID=3064945 RepID=UPI00351F9627
MPKRRPEDPDAVAPIRVEVVPRRGLSRIEAARYVGISTTKFDALVREGQMPQPFRIGARVIWDIRKLDAAFDELSGPDTASLTGWEDWDTGGPRIKSVEEILAEFDTLPGDSQTGKAARRRGRPPKERA